MPALNYDPSLMPAGEQWARLYAYDPTLRKSGGSGESPSEIKIKVDHSSPTLAVSGTATEQAKVGTAATQYTLKYTASDGDLAAPASMTPFGGAGTAPGATQKPSGLILDGQSNLYVVDKENNRIEKFDANGKFLAQFGSKGSGNGQFSEPRGIAINPCNGNLVVVDSGNGRVQQLKPDGTFVSSFGSKGSGGGNQFINPYGVAVTKAAPPNQTSCSIYVSDAGGNRVGVFSENGQFAGDVTGNATNLTGPAQFGEPSGLAISNGTVWVADAQNNRIQSFDYLGHFIGQFGTKGSGAGQLNGPTSVSVTPNETLMVTDANHRVSEFNMAGEVLRIFGSPGSGVSQFSDPKGTAVSSSNVVYVSDAANHRISMWNHASFDPESGVASTEVKLDGGLVEPKYAPGCPSSSCSISREWVLQADNYPVGSHTLEITAKDGVELSTTKSLTVETHGDRTAPSVTLSGSMTEQASLGNTRPAYALKVDATDVGAAEERKSGVVSVSIKIDGATVDSVSPGCPVGGCSIKREWLLKSDSYATGSHTVQVSATDAAGRTTTKSLTIKIVRDAIPPVIAATNALFTAPEGWVEQKNYSYSPLVSDGNGYGVTSVVLKIDGAAINMLNQPCPAGGCSATLSGSVGFAQYEGGAHLGEVVATDGAGNVGRKVWTINVDPKGEVTAEEVEDTLEAAEDTGAINVVGSSEPEDEVEGSKDDLGLKVAEDDYVVSGGLVPARVLGEPGNSMIVRPLDPAYLELSCGYGEDSGVHYSGKEEEELPTSQAEECASAEVPEGGGSDLLSIEVSPRTVSAGADDPEIDAGADAAISANTSAHVDLVTRPLYDGAMTYAAIRDASASETYQWTVKLDPLETLVLLDSKHAQVYEGGHPAFSITAVPARDAIGTVVPTSLAVSEGNVVTLTVAHRGLGPTGQPFVYPVVGGAGWEGGFQTFTVEEPPPEPLPQEDIEEGEGEIEGAIGDGPRVAVFSSGPPEAEASTSAQELNPKSLTRNRKKFKFTYCWPHNIPGDPLDGQLPVPFWDARSQYDSIPRIVSECHREDFNGVYWGVTAHGRFHYIYQHWVWLKDDEWGCDKWGEEQPAKVHCRAFYPEARTGTAGAIHGPIDVVGQFRFRPFHGGFTPELKSTCLEEGGHIFPNPRNAADAPYERPLILKREYVAAGVESCDWRGG